MLTSSYKPLPGRFLISEPFMHDYNFKRSVVLLVEHNDQGSLGFVMNRQMNVSINEIVKDMPPIDSAVFRGGPVEQNSLQFIHRIPNLPNAKLICEGVYWGGNFSQLIEMINLEQIDSSDVLFFVGYSGWGPTQLQHELDEKSWIIAPESPEFIFQNDYSDMWRQVLQKMGTKYKVISNYPVDPRLN